MSNLRTVLAKRLSMVALTLLSALPPAMGQEQSAQRQIYAQAENDYQLGRLEQALLLLQTHGGEFKGSMRQSVYRLMALCHLAQDNNDEAERDVATLLKIDPYYSPMAQDPMRFIDLVNSLKSGRSATITTASNQEESMEEVPVPVTLITEEMIQASGARNLKELLVLCVPGMTHVECNEETNIAMRGIYSSGQEKMLVMLDGHRLNSYGTNVARLDHSISLEKIRQIEVLRGPASSLYGGVALTAVVNIITKRGKDVEGVQVEGEAGNYGQLAADVLFGRQYLDLDVMVWGRLYNATGEKRYIPLNEVQGTAKVDGDVILGGFNRRPTYNFGASIAWKQLRFMYNTAFSKMVAPYSLSYFFSPYTYNDYMTLEGNLPGYAMHSNNVELAYDFDLGQVHLQASAAYDNEDQQRYQVATDRAPDDWIYYLYPQGSTDSVQMANGGFQCLHFKEENVSVQLKGDYGYRWGENHNGSLTAGVQYQHYRLLDAENFEGVDFKKIIQIYDDTKNLQTGSESSANAFLQLKHRWKNFILNGGVRYDYKKRASGDVIHELSPRLALIYLQPTWNVKLSYSKAFVDAPYFYRFNTLDNFSGGQSLKSEYLHSLQLTGMVQTLDKSLSVEANFFHNRATNLIHPEGMVYTNSGSMTNIGAELSASYRRHHLLATGSVVFQRQLKSEGYKTYGHHVYNIPDCTANLVAAYDVLDWLQLNTQLTFTSTQRTTLEMPLDDWSPIYIEEDVPARLVAGLGAVFRYRGFTAKAHAYNLFNHHYIQGGTSVGPIPQQGRWLLFSVAYKF